MKPFTDCYEAGLSGRAVYSIAVVGSGAGFYLFGYDQGVANALQQNADFWLQFPLLKSDATILGAVLGMFVIGAFLGCLTISAMGNYMGRRSTLIIASVGTLVGATLQAASFGLGMFIFSRILNGYFVGILTSTVPPYIAELSKPKYRGTLMASELAIGSTGLMTAFWVAYGFVNNQGPYGWRLPLAFQSCFVLITIVCLLFSPESPRWLIEVGRVEEGRRVLARMYGDDFAASSVLEIQEAIALEHGAAVKGYFACFQKNDQCFRYRTGLSLAVNFFQQATGVNMATYYAGTIFIEAIALPIPKASIALSCLGVSGSIGAFFGAFVLYDRLGRVRTLMLGSTLNGIGMVLLAAGIANIQSSSAAYAAAAGLYLFITSFSMTWLPGGWVYGAEVTPLAIRSQASSYGYAVQYIMNFVIVQVTPVGIKSIAWKFYIPFAISNFLMVPALYFFFPEVSRLSLEGVDELFAGGKVIMRRSPNQKISHEHLDAMKGQVEHIEEKSAGSFA